jgi:uncharacterized cupin superfamily protein
MLPLLVVLEPDGAPHETSTPLGGELFLFMLRGELEIGDDNGTQLRLGRGDAAYLRTDRQRTFRTVGRHQAEWLAVQTPTTL